jgi:uncharacterized protein (DUF736 family)
MCVGDFPFHCDKNQVLRICSADYEMGAEWDAISEESKDLIRRHKFSKSLSVL